MALISGRGPGCIAVSELAITWNMSVTRTVVQRALVSIECYKV